MKKECLLKKISSKYLIKTISSFIKDKLFIYKLFVNSKSLQRKVDINVIDYQEKYLEKRILFEEYLVNDYEESKDLLNDKIQKILLKYQIDENKFKKLASNHFLEYFENIKKENIYKKIVRIDIDLPLFESLSKMENFEQIFAVVIRTESIKNFGNEYLSNINKMKKCFSIELIFRNIKDIIYIKNLSKVFYHIKNINIVFNQVTYDIIGYDNYNEYFKILFSLGNIQTNLVLLNLTARNENKIEPKLFEYINNLKSLQYLFLTFCEFDSTFELTLETLKEINITFCTNITFKDNIFLNLKNLLLYECTVYTSNSLLKLPSLEKCTLIHDYNQYFRLTYDKFIDFSSVTKLKKYKGNTEYFFLIENKNPLEKVSLNEGIFESLENEKKLFEKICSIKTIKKINFSLRNINFQDISNIKGEFPSVKKMTLMWDNEDDLCILDKLQQKFPNLTDFTFKSTYGDDKPQLEIIENSNSKIINLELMIDQYFVKLYCSPFTKLESIKFNICNEIKDLQNSFPIFNDKCTIIFQSLKLFHFVIENYKIDLDILKNLCKNINNMPNLEEFMFICNFDCDVPKEIYIKFIKEIISLKYIKYININIYRKKFKMSDIIDMNEYIKYIYTKDELTELFSDINYNKFHLINIIKYETKFNENK